MAAPSPHALLCQAYTSRIKVNVLLGNFEEASQDYRQLMAIDGKKFQEHQQKVHRIKPALAPFPDSTLLALHSFI